VLERLRARKKLSKTEKQLSRIIFQQTNSTKNFGLIRSKGDKALFNHTTQEMKNHLGVPKGRALADFQPTIILKSQKILQPRLLFSILRKRIRH